MKINSQSTLEDYLGIEAINLREVTSLNDASGLKWQAEISVFVLNIVMDFRVYFNEDGFKGHLTELLEEPLTDMSYRNYLKEYCNRAGGTLKGCLQDALEIQYMEASLSLPHCDEIHQVPDKTNRINQVFWELTHPCGLHLICTFECDIPESVNVAEDFELSTEIFTKKKKVVFF